MFDVVLSAVRRSFAIGVIDFCLGAFALWSCGPIIGGLCQEEFCPEGFSPGTCVKRLMTAGLTVPQNWGKIKVLI